MPTIKKCNKHKHIQNSDPGKIMDLIMSLTDETSALLQVKINTYLREECEADMVFQLIFQVERHEVTVQTIDTEILPRRIKIKMSPKYEEVLKSNCEVSELLTTFEPDIQDIISPYLSLEPVKKRVVMYPLNDKPFSIIFCVVTAQIIEEHVASIVSECSLFMWPTMKKTLALEYERVIKHKCQQLLRANRKVIAQVGCLPTLLKTATEQAKQLTHAQDCSLMLIDVENMDLYNASKQSYQRYEMNIGVIGEVIKTGRVINLRDVNQCPVYNASIDNVSGVNVQNLLCFPLRERAGIIGAGMLINKQNDSYFDATDEEMALSFSIYSGICIVHSTLFGKIQEAHIRNALANELIMYHLKVDEREVTYMMDCKVFHGHPDLITLDFNPRVLALRELPCYVLRMFTDLGLDVKFNIKLCTLARFILQVRRLYRDVAYHSWMHCFSTTQWMYAAIVTFQLQYYYTDLQLLMFLVAALTHDLDHRGTTNSFQLHGRITLGALFSSEGSILERHHLNVALSILNTEGCDILVNVARKEYDRALLMLKELIVATDLTNYIDKQDYYLTIAEHFVPTNRDHLNALSCLLIICADFSDQLKEWSSVKKTAASTLTEFFKQSEPEKSKGEKSAIQLDHDKFSIPYLEMEFLQEICIPIFENLSMILPKIGDYIQTMRDHIEMWDNSRSVFFAIPTSAGLAAILSPELDNLIELKKKEREMEREMLERERLEAEEAEKAAAAAEAALAAKTAGG